MRNTSRGSGKTQVSGHLPANTKPRRWRGPLPQEPVNRKQRRVKAKMEKDAKQRRPPTWGELCDEVKAIGGDLRGEPPEFHEHLWGYGHRD